MSFYDVNGNILLNTDEIDFRQNMEITQSFDIEHSTNYTLIRVFKKKTDGSLQYPFVYAPTGSQAGTKSTLDMNTDDGWFLAINGGLFRSATGIPWGILIENGVVIQQEDTSEQGYKPLTIDSNGDLDYVLGNASASTLVANGIKSAVCGWYPLVVDYESIIDSSQYSSQETYGQRQIIGQFGNGDYAILTLEGRGYDNSTGFSMPDAAELCVNLGMKFAYSLDGGGSTETVLGKKQINTIYENTTGRVVTTYIVFNGKNTFEVPNG